MARGHDITVRCQHPGCPERGRFHYDSRRDADKSSTFLSNWKCVRHTGFTLSIAEPTQTFQATSEVGAGTGGHLFWGKFGFVHGPGFKAYADDFPPGTIIEVTARIILPDLGS